MASKTWHLLFLVSFCISGCFGYCNPKCSSTQYCDDTNNCQTQVFDSYTGHSNLVSDQNYNDEASYSPFRILMISDIQYYYTRCKEQEDLCIFTHASDDVTALEEAADRLSQCVNNPALLTPDVKLIIDGGDLTNTATDAEMQKYDSLFSTLPGNIPIAITLGNHDYGMKTGLLDFTPQAARMISYLESSILDLQTRANAMSNVELKAADFAIGVDTVANVGETKFFKGSFMYSVEVEGIVFIIMHWAPSLKGKSYTDNFAVTTGCPNADSSICETTSGKNEYFEITNGFAWLESQFRKIERRNKKVVLVPHFVKALADYVTGAARSDLRAYIQNHVVAVLTGHDHDQWGEWGKWQVDSTINNAAGSVLVKNGLTGIPVFYAGSASYEKMITADFHYDKNAGTVSVSVQAITTESGTAQCSGVAPDNSDDP